MTPPPHPSWDELVRAWQGRVHALARRMTGDPVEAEDATQEAFVRLLEQLDRYDPRRPLAPWVYRVALNAIRNRLRSERVRRRGRVDVDPDRATEPAEEAAVERAEAQAIVQDHLQALEPEARAVLLLHLDAGLSKKEMAEVLGVPRTTVQSRFQRALGSLRESLVRNGHTALAPAAGELLKGLPPVEVPAHLTRTLLTLEGSTKLAAASATLATGGLVMTKSIVLAGAAIALFLVAGGYAAGRFWLPSPRSTADGARTTHADAEVSRLAARNAELEAEVARLHALGGASGADGTADRGARLRGTESAPGDAAGDAKRAPAGTAASDTSAREEQAVSWAHLEKAMQENRELFLRIHDQDPQSFTPEEQKKLYGVLAALLQDSVAAQALSSHPFFDERVLPGYVRAIFGPALDMSEAERAGVERTVRNVLRQEAAGFDPDGALPLERYRRRRQVVHAVVDAVVRGLSPESRARYDALQGMPGAKDDMLDGSHRIVVLGLGNGPDFAHVAGEIVDEWTEAYGLDESQQDEARPAAANLARTADSLLTQAGIVEEARTWERSDQSALADALLRAQQEAEQSFLSRLTPEQIEKARASLPTVLLFDRTSGKTVSVSNGGGI